MPGFLLHVGATVLCAHGGQAQPTVPNPRVIVMGQPTVADDEPVRGRRLRASAAAGRQRPVRHRAMDHRRGAGHVERPAAAAARQPGDLRADRHAAADHRHADARHSVKRDVTGRA